MEWIIDMLPVLMLVALVLFVSLGYPVAFSIGALALIFGLPLLGIDFFNLLPIRIWESIIKNTFLLAVPLFVFMGVMLEKSGLAESLLDILSELLHKIPGNLAVAVIMMGAILAASTGIIGATVVTMTVLALPTLLKRGYSPELSTGVICASGTLGQIIPPSIVLLLLASVAQVQQVNPGKLFFAALIPGLLLVLMYVGYAIFTSSIGKNRPKETILPNLEKTRLITRSFRALLPPALLMFAVLGSIFLGIATPTEAAGVGALGASMLALSQRKLNWGILREVMRSTTQFTSMVMMILVGASAFGLVFRGLQGDRLLQNFFLSLHVDLWLVIALIMVILFVLGFFLDFLEITFIHIPILLPIVISLGVDPLWFMVLVAINLQTSFLTPPFGFALFYLKGAAPPDLELSQIYRGIIPFVIIQLIALTLVIIFPQLATWLPQFVK
jgi:tripartite ATP-independent transporter DctM subunit